MKDTFKIPAIHNYYSDLMLSLAYFFDNTVLTDNVIQNYQFNIGSKTFQLDYKPQVSLPSAIINYQQSEMQQYHDWFIRRPEMNNPLLIPIVYDSTKDLTLLLQEATYEHMVSITINYESVMQMLEAEHRLRTYLPLNKYIEYFTFYTFYEIPQYYLNPMMFDTNRDEIFNLFTKRDSITNELVEMASVKYNPMIRLNSIGSMGINSDQRSFSLSLDFTILNPVPMYFQFDHGDIPRLTKQINEIFIEDICLPIYENIPIIQIKYIDNEKIISKYVPLLNIDSNNNFNTIFDNFTLTGKIISRWDIYHAMIESNNYSYSVTIKIDRTKEYYTILVSGALEGNILNPVWDENSDEISGTFSGRFNHSTIDTDINIVEDVILTIKKPTKYIQFNLDNVELLNNITDEKIKIENIKTIPYGQLTLLQKEFNDNRLNIVLDKSIVSGLGIYNTQTKEIDFMKSVTSISEAGTIQLSTNKKYNINNEEFIEYFTVTGCINSNTWRYSFNQVYEQDQIASYPLYVLVSGTFNNEPKYGASYIEHINIDLIGSYYGSDMFLSTNDRYFHDFVFLKKDNDNIIHSVVVPNTADYIEFDCDYAYISLTKHDDIKYDNKDLTSLYWTMVFKDQTYTNLNSPFKLGLVYKKPFYCSICLKVPIKYYTLYFAKYNTVFDKFFVKIYENRGSVNAQVSES